MIEFQQVTKRYGRAVAVQELSLNIEQGEFTMLIGGSGSGKSTTLKMINRMVEHDSGRILFMGEQIRRFKAEELRRRMGYAIQSIGLFPHWTVERNIAAVPALLQWPQARIRDRVTELLELLGLPPDAYRGRYPHQLSGGQQQRVGVARALAADPEVLLMDEPFGALDPVTRKALQAEMARIHRVSRKTIVMVTHDIDEALLLGTRVVLMDQGRVVQAGVPADLLVRPHDDAVKAFVGQADLGVRLLGLQQVSDRARPDDHAAAGEPVRSDVSLREALSLFVARSTDRLPVVDPQGRAAGVLHFADLLVRPA